MLEHLADVVRDLIVRTGKGRDYVGAGHDADEPPVLLYHWQAIYPRSTIR